MTEEKKMTGYPSIDKPWLKYYSDESINASLPQMTMFQYVYENNKCHLDDIAFDYQGREITYSQFFSEVKNAAKAFKRMGVSNGDIVTIMSMHTPETIISIYALNYIGAIANLIYVSSSLDNIVENVKLTDSKMLLILDLLVDKMIEIGDMINIPIVVLSVYDSLPGIKKLLVKLARKK